MVEVTPHAQNIHTSPYEMDQKTLKDIIIIINYYYNLNKELRRNTSSETTESPKSGHLISLIPITEGLPI